MGSARKDSEPRRKKAPDIRPLDMFLLGLVKGGLITPYDWQSRARTSLGASLPAVRRPLDAGLLRKAAKGPRGRHEFALTSKGQDCLEKLRSYVQDALDEPRGDLESVLRLACLASVIGDTRMAKKLLSEARDTHRRRAGIAKKRTISDVPFRSRLAGLYSKVLARCEAAQETAMADQLELLARLWDTATKEILQLWQDER
jgi:hypothetical protein